MSLTLHYHPLSSFCWKALVALYENGAPFTPHMVNLGDPAERAALLALWPIGRFPVLRDETRGETVPESSIVIEYLDRHYPGAVKLIPDHPDLALQTRLRDRFLDLYVHLLTQKIVGDRLRLAGTTVDVVPTPGHCSDHLAFRIESGAVLVGDHVLGRGTSVVTHPEGDVVAYLESLRRVRDLGPSALYCGHGPELTENPEAVLEYYLAHRAYREGQVLAALQDGATTVDELVASIYAEVPREVWFAAAQSTRATLDKLRAEGRVEQAADGTVRPA